MKTVSKAIAVDLNVVAAFDNLKAPKDSEAYKRSEEWAARASMRIEQLMREHAPSGSGFDNGTKLSDKATPNRLVFDTAFHAMNEHGTYVGWTHFVVTVTPCLAWGIEVKAKPVGKDRYALRDYVAEQFHHFMSIEVA